MACAKGSSLPDGSMAINSLYPDLVLTNGRIITLDKYFSLAEAVAIKDGRIVAVGKNIEIRKLAGPPTKLLDLSEKTVLPGINDGHLHPSWFGMARPPFMLDLGPQRVKSLSDVARIVGDRAKAGHKGEWIIGRGWDTGYLDECLKDTSRMPARQDLDTVTPESPVILDDFSAHKCWVNSIALKIAGITRETQDPSGGQVVRDAHGEPTGLLLEKAMALVKDIVPPWSREQKKKGLLAAMKELNSLGITSMTDASANPQEVSIYNDLVNEGLLTVRVNLMLMWYEYGKGVSQDAFDQFFQLVGTHTGFGNEWLRVAGVKIFADGIPGPSRTAWMHRPYLIGGSGSLVVPGATEEERYQELMRQIVYSHRQGFQLGIHAVGDRAIDACVDGFEQAMKEYPWDARHYVIHGDFVAPACAVRMARGGFGVNAQPCMLPGAYRLLGTVGEERVKDKTPLKSLVEAGVHVTSSSDAPVNYPDWKLGIEGALLRESQGKVYGPEHRLTRDEAIRSYTIEGAWQTHQENLKGSIEPGKLADFCVLDQDIMTADVRRIKDIAILMTMVGGKIVYNATPDIFEVKHALSIDAA